MIADEQRVADTVHVIVGVFTRAALRHITGRSASADLVEIGSGGGITEISSGLTREALSRGGALIPLTLLAFPRLIPFAISTDAGARGTAPRS